MTVYNSQRRSFLKSASVLVSLPVLESTAHAEEVHESPSRLVCIGSNLGFYAPAFFPNETGSDYRPSDLLREIDQHRDDYTVFSGFDHRAGNGHANWDNFLCGKRIGTQSLDQIVAEKFGQDTRFPSIQLCAGEIPKQRMCFDRQGTPLPMLNRPSALYEKLFSSPSGRKRTEYILKSGRSSLDTVRAEAKSLASQVSHSDQVKLDEYFSALREVETNIGRQLRHLRDDTQKVDYVLPPYDPIAPTLMLECEQIMLDLIAIALETDATHVATLFIAGLGQVFTLDGETMRAGYHALSHHGSDPDLIRDLVRVEKEHFRCFGRFLSRLKQSTDSAGKPLLDSTVVLLGTGMGDASRHSNRNLPTLIAGGGFQHGRHIATDPTDTDAPLLGNVYQSVLQKFGIPQKTFADADSGLSNWS